MKWNPHQNGTLIKMEHSSKWNTHQNGTLILSKGILIKNGPLILSKWNTHIIKMEYSSKWNPHQNGTLIKMEPSYYQKEHSSKWNPHIIKMELIK